MTIGPAFGVQVDPSLQVVPLMAIAEFTSDEFGMLVNVFAEPLIDLFVSVWVSVVPTMRPLAGKFSSTDPIVSVPLSTRLEAEIVPLKVGLADIATLPLPVIDIRPAARNYRIRRGFRAECDGRHADRDRAGRSCDGANAADRAVLPVDRRGRRHAVHEERLRVIVPAPLLPPLTVGGHVRPPSFSTRPRLVSVFAASAAATVANRYRSRGCRRPAAAANIRTAAAGPTVQIRHNPNALIETISSLRSARSETIRTIGAHPAEMCGAPKASNSIRLISASA